MSRNKPADTPRTDKFEKRHMKLEREAREARVTIKYFEGVVKELRAEIAEIRKQQRARVEPQNGRIGYMKRQEIEPTPKHLKAAKIYVKTGNKSAAARAVNVDERNATHFFARGVMKKAVKLEARLVLKAAKMDETRIGRKINELADAEKETEFGTQPNHPVQLDATMFAARLGGLLDREDDYTRGGSDMLRMLLPLIAEFVALDDKAHFDERAIALLRAAAGGK